MFSIRFHPWKSCECVREHSVSEGGVHALRGLVPPRAAPERCRRRHAHPGWLTWLNYGTHNLWTFVILFKVLCRYYSLKQGIWVYQAFRRKSLPLPSLSVNCTFPARSVAGGWRTSRSRAAQIIPNFENGRRCARLFTVACASVGVVDRLHVALSLSQFRNDDALRRASKNRKLFPALQGAVRCWRVDWKR